YRLAGITADPATHDRTPPELLDLLAALEEAGADRLAALLEPWSVGAYSGLCSGQTTLRPAGELVVWALGELPGDQERLAAVAVLLVVHALWTDVVRGGRRAPGARRWRRSTPRRCAPAPGRRCVPGSTRWPAGAPQRAGIGWWASRAPGSLGRPRRAWSSSGRTPKTGLGANGQPCSSPA